MSAEAYDGGNADAHCCACRPANHGHVGGLQLCPAHAALRAAGTVAVPDPVGAYVSLLEAQLREAERKLLQVGKSVGRGHSILIHSRDNTATVDEVRGVFTDLLDVLGVSG